MDANLDQIVADKQGMRKILARYQNPDVWRSLWELATSIIPYLLLWVAMVYSLRISYFLTLALSVLAAGFMMRTFIIFHDCGHGSFFKSRRANEIVGVITGLLTFTPYHHWRRDHAIHHATAGDLDRRGVGDVKILTVQEFLAMPGYKRLAYRVLRSPWIMFTIGSFLVFSVFHRFPRPKSDPVERRSVYWTNFALAGLIALLIYTIGWQAYLLIQVPILFFGTSVGVWLFYVQHNFEGTYWKRHPSWDFTEAGLYGSSFYKLPGLLQWFSGNIGFHHIHHLNSRIPNYLLPKCYRDNQVFHIQPLTIKTSLRSLRLRFWDEAAGRMVGLEILKTLPDNPNV